MSDRKQLAVDTNILMDAVKPDGAADVPDDELRAAREVGTKLLTEFVLVYSKKIEQEWTAKGLVSSNSLLTNLLRNDRLRLVVVARLNGGQVRELGKHVDRDDQPFVLAAAVIDDGARVLVTRDPKTTLPESRRHVKKEYGVAVKKASEFINSS